MPKKKTAIRTADEIRAEQGREPDEDQLLLPEPESPEERLAREMEEDVEPEAFTPRRKGCGERR